MKYLNGKELASYIKDRQAHNVRSLIQAAGITPKLAILVTVDNPVIDLYMRLKQRYAQDIGIELEVFRLNQSDLASKLKLLNEDSSVNGIIIQLPLADPTQTEELVNLVDPNKDVDALGSEAKFDPATPMAILWLLAGYNIELKGKNVVLIGNGKLVGQPLKKLLASSGISVSVADSSTKDIGSMTLEADIIITATGHPAILKSTMVKSGAVVVDAGVASEGAKTVGDVDPELFNRLDISITPEKGGVGPLTVCALFDNVIRAADRLRP